MTAATQSTQTLRSEVSVIEASPARSTQQRGRRRRRPPIPALALPQPEERQDYDLESFYRFICILAAMYGFCFASNSELGKWQKRDEDTIRRRIRKLEAAGYIRVVPRSGKENWIYPLVAPLPHPGSDGWQEEQEWEEANLSKWQRGKRALQRKAAEVVDAVTDAVSETLDAVADRISHHPQDAGTRRGQIKQPVSVASQKGKLTEGTRGVDAGGLRGVNPAAPFSINNISENNNNLTPPDADAAPPAPDAVPDPVVVALVDAGFCADKAAGFVSEVGPDCVRESLAVLEYYQKQGREIASPGGFLADFGRHFHAGTWSLPGGLVKQREEKRKEAEQAAEKARLAAVEAEKKRQNAEQAATRAEAEKAKKEREQAERDAMIPADLREPWRLALEKLQSLVNKPTFHGHILKLLPVAAAEDGITIATDASSTLEWLRGRHTDSIAKALGEVLQREVNVRLVLSANWIASLATGRNGVSPNGRPA